jgi:excisionase family DNA binding protein
MKRTLTLADLEDNPDGALQSTSAVCDCLQLSLPTVIELIEAKDLRAVRIGRAYKVVWHSLRDYCFRIGAIPLTPSERKRMEDDLARRRQKDPPVSSVGEERRDGPRTKRR